MTYIVQQFNACFCLQRKEMIAQQREYKKKKALKKAQRIKELEQEREDQKVKWQQFNNRAYSKNKKGQVGKSFLGKYNCH
jgi:survival-of-motor-neuron-related-splicing factor 30